MATLALCMIGKVLFGKFEIFSINKAVKIPVFQERGDMDLSPPLGGVWICHPAYGFYPSRCFYAKLPLLYDNK